MEAEFKLARQENRRGHFAHVIVETEVKSNGICVIEAIREPINESRCEVNRRISASWIDAAIAGARNCAETLVSLNKISGCQVRVTHVIGIIVDTSEEDLFCAGALATWKALIKDEELPKYHFENDKWHIKY